MISPVAGEIVLTDGLRFRPHEELAAEHIRDATGHRLLPIPGWSRHFLGEHPSEHGRFEIEAISDRDSRIHVVLLAHAHDFYRAGAPDDAERRAFHEGVIGSDLHGQREFAWGEVFCRLDPEAGKDWLVIAYTPGPHVPRGSGNVPGQLHEHEPEPALAIWHLVTSVRGKPPVVPTPPGGITDREAQ